MTELEAWETILNAMEPSKLVEEINGDYYAKVNNIYSCMGLCSLVILLCETYMISERIEKRMLKKIEAEPRNFKYFPWLFPSTLKGWAQRRKLVRKYIKDLTDKKNALKSKRAKTLTKKA